MVRYIKCPRCELNYIDPEVQEYCDVCLKELKGIRTDADEMEEEEENEPLTELCPVCGENMMRAGEKMCEECRRKSEFEEEPDPENEDDDEWREYLDDETDDMGAEMEEIGESFDEDELEDEEEEEEEPEEYHDEEEDLEYVTGDEIYTLTDDDEDDDEESDEYDF